VGVKRAGIPLIDCDHGDLKRRITCCIQPGIFFCPCVLNADATLWPFSTLDDATDHRVLDASPAAGVPTP
jgi:hypothetical protein